MDAEGAVGLHRVAQRAGAHGHGGHRSARNLARAFGGAQDVPACPCATRRSSTDRAGISVSPTTLTSGTVRVTPSPERPRLIVPSPAAAAVRSGRLTTAAGNCDQARRQRAGDGDTGQRRRHLALLAARHRQDDGPPRDRGGEDLVMGRQAEVGQHRRDPIAEARPAFGDALRRGAVGFREQNVVAHCRRAMVEQPIGQRGQVAARPGPLSIGVERGLVDIDDVHRRVGIEGARAGALW
jgi:hypothetical protein